MPQGPASPAALGAATRTARRIQRTWRDDRCLRTASRSPQVSSVGSADARYWLLVDIGPDEEAPLSYFIVPEPWIENYISKRHRTYLSTAGKLGIL